MRILLIGCGAMGKQFLRNWLTRKIKAEFFIVDPNKNLLENEFISSSIHLFNNAIHISSDMRFDIVFLAIKPQSAEEAILSIPQECYEDSKVFSIMAGITIKKVLSLINKCIAIVRIMPNMGILSGTSVNLVCMEKVKLSIENTFVEDFLNGTGTFLFFDDEMYIDSLTPISGSGIAYFMLLAQKLAEMASHIGINHHDAVTMASSILISSAEIVKSNNNFSEIIRSISSKGGVTEVAVNELSPFINKGMDKAFELALNKVKELKHDYSN